MAAIHLTSADFQKTLDEAGDKPVFVDFYAEWCGPCKMAAPIIEELSVEYADKAILAKVDVDQNQDLAQQHHVLSIPTVVVFKNGQPVGEPMIGFRGREGYVQMLEAALKSETGAQPKAE
ncbi:MAG: thioredoxin [Candidatus Pacebacteria bacterium CG_4_10_14_0_8_um_filter_43_12]|nr:MAG: thioredoxin [Candidatus Pacebacteria bacterium CG_4_10_14_0_8_um_filter_43_12]